MDIRYALWRRELAGEAHNHQTLAPKDGFWRMVGARTKHDTPVSIWADEGIESTDKTVVKIGRKKPFPAESDEGMEFFAGFGWGNCVACTETEYHIALDSGVWPDGKRSRKEEPAKSVQLPDNWGDLSHDPSTNAPPVDEVLKDQITEAITSAEKFETVKTQGEADKAAEILDRLRKLWKDGDTARATEKKPHDDAASKVQAKWLPVIDPARIAATELKGKVAAFLKAEEDRVRIAHAQAAEGDAEAAMPLPKVQARTAYSRATSLRTVRRGWITDHKKFVAALIKNKDQDFIDFLTNKANALARAKTTLPGMEIKETKE